MRLGGHLKSSDGLTYALMAARSLGHKCMQIMLGGNTDWKPFDISREAVQNFKVTSNGIDLYVHLPFVINPCQPGRMRNLAKAAFFKYAALAQEVTTKAVILHPGFKKELTEDEAYDNFLVFFADVLKHDFRFKILLETDAGSKNKSAVGSLRFIEKAIKDLGDPRVSMCLDTCHLYASGLS